MALIIEVLTYIMSAVVAKREERAGSAHQPMDGSTGHGASPGASAQATHRAHSASTPAHCARPEVSVGTQPTSTQRFYDPPRGSPPVPPAPPAPIPVLLLSATPDENKMQEIFTKLTGGRASQLAVPSHRHRPKCTYRHTYRPLACAQHVPSSGNHLTSPVVPPTAGRYARVAPPLIRPNVFLAVSYSRSAQLRPHVGLMLRRLKELSKDSGYARKVIIFSMFPTRTELVAAQCCKYGIGVAPFHGKMANEARRKIIELACRKDHFQVVTQFGPNRRTSLTHLHLSYPNPNSPGSHRALPVQSHCRWG